MASLLSSCPSPLISQIDSYLGWGPPFRRPWGHLGRRLGRMCCLRRLSLQPCAAPFPHPRAPSVPPPPSYVPPSVIVSLSRASCALLPSSFAQLVPPRAFPAAGWLGSIDLFLCGSSFYLRSDSLMLALGVDVECFREAYTNTTLSTYSRYLKRCLTV